MPVFCSQMHSQTLSTRLHSVSVIQFCAESALLLREWSTDPCEGSGHSDPPFLSLCQLFFLTLHVMQEQHLSRRAAPLKQHLSVQLPGWYGLNSAAGTELREQPRSDVQVFTCTWQHTITHTHMHTVDTNFPLLISINHWPFCKCCWLPIINDYALLAAGKVTRVKAGLFTGHYSVEVCVVTAKKRTFPSCLW